MAEPKDVGAGKRFATPWHRDQYAADLERELLGVQQRLAGEDLAPEAREVWETAQRTILDDLKSLGRAAEKRPAGRAKETR